MDKFEKITKEMREYGFYVCTMSQDYRTWKWRVCINIHGLWASAHGSGDTATEALKNAFEEAKSRTRGRKLKTPLQQMMDNFVREGKTTRESADEVIAMYEPKKKERFRLKKKRVRLKR